MLKEMSRIKTSKNFKEHTSTSFSRRLFVCLIEGRPPAISHKSSLVHDEISAKKSAIYWDEFSQSPGRYYYKLNRKKLSFE